MQKRPIGTPVASIGVAWPLLALAAVAPLWIGELPPLSDLPQHAAQVSILRHWNDPACGYPALYEVRWLDPYGLGYALACTGDWDLVCCGHSHVAETRTVADVKGGSTWLVNPGTVAGLAGVATWVLGDLAQMRFDVHTIPL